MAFAAPPVAPPETTLVPPAEAPAKPPAPADKSESPEPPPTADKSPSEPSAPPADTPSPGSEAETRQATAPPPPAPPVELIAANGLPLPPPEKPPVPARCPPLDPAALTEVTPSGRLPRIAENGCMPWLANAAAFNYRETRPRVGVILLGLGRNAALMQRAIENLPPQISLGFLPDTPQLDRWIERARARGHEALVMLPVQSTDRAVASGLPPLRADLPAEENIRRLHAVLARAGSGYIGVIVPTTTPLSEAEPVLRPLLQEIADRGLLVLETFRTERRVYELSKELGVPYSSDAGWIDRQGETDEITANLEALEKFTHKNRFALAVGMAQRETIERLVTWSKEVEERGLALTPVTGLTECLDLCASRVRKAMAGGP
jgi:polysaccharide deacetylase 2 family uncharacterized protein YibQ